MKRTLLEVMNAFEVMGKLSKMTLPFKTAYAIQALHHEMVPVYNRVIALRDELLKNRAEKSAEELQQSREEFFENLSVEEETFKDRDIRVEDLEGVLMTPAEVARLVPFLVEAD